MQAPSFDARVPADAPVFLPGMEASKTSREADHILGFLEADDTVRAAGVSRGFHRALQDSTTVRIHPRQGNIQQVLEKYLTKDDQGYYTENRRISELDLDYCHQLTDKDLAFVAEYFPALKVLKLCSCDNITDVGLESVPRLKNLQHLNLKFCGLITDVGLVHVSMLEDLQHLDLRNCHFITDVGLANFGSKTQIHR